MKRIICITFIFSLCGILSAQNLNTNFYSIPDIESKSFKDKEGTDDSKRFQQFIEAQQKPLKVYIEPGTYYLNNIHIPSNVHLLFDKDAEVKPVANKNKISIFNLGIDGPRVENVSISCTEGSFLIDLRDYKANAPVRVITVQNVQHFRFENMIIQDNYTKFSAIAYNIAQYQGASGETLYGWPRWYVRQYLA